MADKEKKIIFSEIIDKKINGFALGISFMLISTFLLLNNTYFYWEGLTYFIGAFFGMIGLAGVGVELDKSKKIKGIGNLVVGLIAFGIWLWIYISLENNAWANFLSLIFLIFGVYGIVKGLIEFFYSIWLEIANSNRSFTKITKAIFLFITQLCGLALTILNILKIFKLV